MKLMEEFGSLLQLTTEFQVGYIFDKQSTKFWLMCQEDLKTMNKSIKKAKYSVMLWCEARSAKRKRTSQNPPPSKRQQIEEISSGSKIV